MTQPEIKTPEQLKGGTVAVARFGGAADFVARYALARLGLSPGKDVTIVQTGSTPERLAAMEARRATGSTLVPPATFIAQRKGFHLLADVAALGLAYQHQGGVTTRKFLRENPTVVRNFVKSYIEAVHRLKTDRATGIKIAAKYLRLEDPELLKKTYESSIDENKLTDETISDGGRIKIIIDQLAATNPKAKTAKPQDFIDARFVEEFDKSGYIDSLYGRKKSDDRGPCSCDSGDRVSSPRLPAKRFYSLLIFESNADFGEPMLPGLAPFDAFPNLDLVAG